MFRSECWSSYQRWLAPVYDPLGDTLVKANSLGAASTRISGLLILLGIANFGCAQISDSFSSAPIAIKRATLKFKLFRGCLIITHGAIGNLENLNLLIDTGTDPSILDNRIAEKIHAKLEVVALDTIQAKVRAWQTHLLSLKVGPITSRDTRVLVEDLSFLERGIGVRVDALIGLDVLGKQNFIVDYGARSISFGVSNFSSSGLTFMQSPPLVGIAMRFDGYPVELMLDTGASSLMLFHSHWRMAPKVSHVQHSTNLAGDLVRRMVEFKTATIGTLDLGRQNAYFVEDGNNAQSEFDGLVNPALLGFRQISFDFAKNRFGWIR